MAENAPDPQMTIPELLEAHRVIRARLQTGTGGGPLAGNQWNHGARDRLLLELQEIEAELADQGYPHA